MRRTAGLVGVLAALLALTGCSQVAAIAPVGGGRMSEVRYAGIDVLTKAGVEILTAPVCTQSTVESIACEGTTVDGTAIRVTSAADAQDTVTVTVGAQTLYDGSLQSVLDEAMRP